MLALLNFIVLVSLFLFYKSGYFNVSKNKQIFVSPNGGVMSNTSTTKNDEDSLKQYQYLRFASSKSMLILDKPIVYSDSLPWAYDSLKVVEFEQQRVRMLSSKSGVIFNESPFMLDSVDNR